MSPFFTSRWVDKHEHVTEVPAGGLPHGFRAAGAAGGIKGGGKLDVGLMVCDATDVVSAARFTRSGVLAAPVLVTRERTQLDGIRAVVVNSGNANAATGGRGMDDAAKMQGSAAMAAGVGRENLVAVCSTGVIGVHLPMSKVTNGILAAMRGLSRDGDAAFAEAIQTTDAFEKRATLQIALEQGTVTLSGQAKGAGMIQPGFATLLVFVQTDAAMSSETADLLLGVTVKRSFERISVDGQLSTNDTVILQCSGASGVHIAPETPDELRFGEALDSLMRQLALMVVRDGEGARRAGRLLVGGGDLDACSAVARSVANSPLVKTALYGADPNWGRIAQAIGAALPGTAPLQFDISIQGVKVAHNGAAAWNVDLEALTQAVRDATEVDYEIVLPGEGAETEVFFSDLGHEYITINADYTT
jgi:glutamate N-acetyltransferase/amino-acid N-acetyltransferase